MSFASISHDHRSAEVFYPDSSRANHRTPLKVWQQPLPTKMEEVMTKRTESPMSMNYCH